MATCSTLARCHSISASYQSRSRIPTLASAASHLSCAHRSSSYQTQISWSNGDREGLGPTFSLSHSFWSKTVSILFESAIAWVYVSAPAHMRECATICRLFKPLLVRPDRKLPFQPLVLPPPGMLLHPFVEMTVSHGSDTGPSPVISHEILSPVCGGSSSCCICSA